MGGLITNPGHAITLGDLRLMQAGRPAVHDGFTLDVSKDGFTWGNPAVVISTLISELSDGDIVTQTRAGNREPVLYVRIEADTHAGLIAGDSALSAVVGLPCELSWQNPDPLAPLTVIDVVHSRMDHAWDDWDALNRRRVWIISMSALPWPRSADLVVTPAVATPVAAPTVVNNGSATTGWTSSNGTLTVVSGAVVTTYDPSIGTDFSGTDLVLAGAIDTSVQKYIAVDWKTSLAVYQALWLNSDPFNQPTEVRREPAPTATFTRSWYKVPDATASLSSLKFVVIHAKSTGSATLSIDQVVKAETLPVIGTARQLARTIDPGGNVTAEGTVIVQHATTGLRQTIVFSHPTQGGYSPPLRQWRVAGSTPTTDVNSVSGFRNTLDTVISFCIPTASIPRGDVHLWGRILRPTAGAGTILGAAYSAAATGAYVGDSQPFRVDRTFPADEWVLVPLARLTLPTSEIGPVGFVQIDMNATGLQLDEAWLFAMDKGRLTILDCGAGTPTIGTISNRLRIEAPSLAEPFGGILVGVAADWSNAHTPAASTVLCDQTGHRFDLDDGSMIHVVTSGPSTEASVSFEHYPRWRAEAG